MNPNTFDILPQEVTMRLSEEMLRDSALLNRIAPQRDGHYVPLPDAFLAARADFAEKWKNLTEYGIDAGYLDNEPCYECGGELQVTTQTTKWVSR